LAEKEVSVCRLCGTSNLTTPCPETDDKRHIAMNIKGEPTVTEKQQSVNLSFMLKNECLAINVLRDKETNELKGFEFAYTDGYFVRMSSASQMFLEVQGPPPKDDAKSV